MPGALGGRAGRRAPFTHSGVCLMCRLCGEAGHSRSCSRGVCRLRVEKILDGKRQTESLDGSHLDRRSRPVDQEPCPGMPGRRASPRKYGHVTLAGQCGKHQPLHPSPTERMGAARRRGDWAAGAPFPSPVQEVNSGCRTRLRIPGCAFDPLSPPAISDEA